MRASPSPWRHPILHWGWQLLSARRRLAIRVVLLSCFASLSALMQPLLSRILVDDGALAGDMKTLAIAAAMMMAVPLIGLAMESVTRFDYLALSSHVLFGLRERVFEHLQALSPMYYSRVGFGDLVSRFDGDLAEVQRFLVDGPLALLNGLFSLISILVLMALLDFRMTLVVLLAMLPLPLLHALQKRAAIEQSTREARRQSTRLSGFFLDTLRSVKLIQSANGEAARLQALRERHGDYYQALKASQKTAFSLAAGQRVASVAGSTLVFGCGGYLLARGQITAGLLVAFVGYAARVGGPAHTLAGVLGGWRRMRVSLERLSELLDAEAEREHASGQARLPDALRGQIDLQCVSFAYDAHKPVLERASLHIPAGSKVLMLGPSGAGKSTFSDLLLGHLRACDGRILVDGIDVGEVPVADLRRRIAVVEQDPMFFPGTVAENLRFVSPQAGDAELRAVLRAAGIDASELGLDTHVGGLSVALSRGQRQRLALARTLLQDPDILVLDETTSAVDRETERKLLELVHRRFAGRTCIFITHHVRTASGWDMVCHLRHGSFDMEDGKGVRHGD